MKASDTVYHKLTNQEWYVLHRNGNKLYVIWPPNIVDASDCIVRMAGNGLLEVEQQAVTRLWGDRIVGNK